jgi:hypothetical protein
VKVEISEEWEWKSTDCVRLYVDCNRLAPDFEARRCELGLKKIVQGKGKVEDNLLDPQAADLEPIY